MVWEQVSPTARIPDGASASVTDMATILGTTHGGAQWRITDAVGIHITDGAHGVALPSPTCTGSGATQLIRVRAQPGRILTPGTTALRRAAPITIHKQAGARSLAGVTTPISAVSVSVPRVDIGVVTPEHDRWQGLQHQYLHGEHLRIPRWRHLQPEHWYRRRRWSWICGQHLHRAGHGWARRVHLQHQHERRYCCG